MRECAGQLSLEIGSDLPEFTRHDLSHMDALWELANLIAGPGITFNPAEAFVFGGAILTHDLAMSRAACQLSDGSIRSRPEWPDALAAEIRAQYGRPPHPSELASPPAGPAQAAEKHLLRALHAETAEALPLSSWTSLRGDTVYMISDSEIRTAYGRLIGTIAASHHWNYDDVVDKFSAPVGVPGFAPIDWKVDGLILACLLRTADAAHLDASRAPDLLAAVRKLSPESVRHWTFQSRLQRPYMHNGRLVFTASDGFSRDEMSAWWLAYDTLRLVDVELKGADAILLEKGRPPFQVRGVAHVESPKEFSSVVPCRDWEPIEAQIKVGDVASLVRRLGGAELYGSDSAVGLRELLTNACDAVKAREALALYKGGKPFYGRVSIWVEEDDSGSWLVCSDNGIGMSPKVLGQQLLDFGCSSWLSPEVVRDNVGLLASRFEPTGKFGIGFFSIFMMGSRVEVWSRPMSGAPSDTWLLEFSSGVEVRPSLRRAKKNEELDDPGTTIRVLLDERVAKKVDQGYAFAATVDSVSMRKEGHVVLSDLLPHLLPAPHADIWVSNDLSKEKPCQIMAKDDWLTIDGASLLRRIFGIQQNKLELSGPGDAFPEELAESYGPKLKIVNDSEGVPVGRIALLSLFPEERVGMRTATVTAGPSRTRSAVHAIVGLLVGKPGRAARDTALPLISGEAMGQWVTAELPNLLNGTRTPGEWCRILGEGALSLGADVGDLPMWQVAQGWLTTSELISWLSACDVVKAVDSMYTEVRIGLEDKRQINLRNDVVVVESSWSSALYPDPRGRGEWIPSDRFTNSCRGVFLEAVRAAWGEVAYGRAMASLRDRHSDNVMSIGTHEGEEVTGRVFEVSRV